VDGREVDHAGGVVPRDSHAAEHRAVLTGISSSPATGLPGYPAARYTVTVRFCLKKSASFATAGVTYSSLS
jgi:hypothetical protein